MVKCSCGFLNPDDAKYCQECGSKLSVKKVPKRVLKQKRDTKETIAKPPVKPDNEDEPGKQGIIYPVDAAILNIALPGWGMAYLKEYSKAVLCFIIVASAAYIGSLAEIWLLTVPIAYLLVIAWTYDETKKYNQRNETNQSIPI